MTSEQQEFEAEKSIGNVPFGAMSAGKGYAAWSLGAIFIICAKIVPQRKWTSSRYFIEFAETQIGGSMISVGCVWKGCANMR